MKKDVAGGNALITGDMLNERLDGQALSIERISILLEEAKLDPNDVMVLDDESVGKLMELLSIYEAFLEHFRDMTEDTVAAVKGLTTARGGQCCGEAEDADVDDEPPEWQE